MRRWLSNNGEPIVGISSIIAIVSMVVFMTYGTIKSNERSELDASLKNSENFLYREPDGPLLVYISRAMLTSCVVINELGENQTMLYGDRLAQLPKADELWTATLDENNEIFLLQEYTGNWEPPFVHKLRETTVQTLRSAQWNPSSKNRKSTAASPSSLESALLD